MDIRALTTIAANRLGIASREIGYGISKGNFQSIVDDLDAANSALTKISSQLLTTGVRRFEIDAARGDLSRAIELLTPNPFEYSTHSTTSTRRFAT